MNLPLSERFTSVQKDDLKAALGKASSNEPELSSLTNHVAANLRITLSEAPHDMTEIQIDQIVESVVTDIIDHGVDLPDHSTDDAVQAVEDFLCI